MERPDIRDLCRIPVVIAPMAGVPSTVQLVAGGAEAGALGFLAAGYKSASAVAQQIRELRGVTDRPFGVNVFVPGTPGRLEDVAPYMRAIAPEAAGLGVELGDPAWDDDDWDCKIRTLVADPPAVVSFTFGCPDRETVTAFHDAGSAVGVTVTNVAEARSAAASGADFLSVQGAEAGAHRGTFTNDDEALAARPLLALLSQIGGVTDLPLLAAGGIMDADAASTALAAGAVAVQCGTAFLCCPESGADPLHKEALTEGRYTTTTLTRAFSGRPARGLVNRFVADHTDAPPAYPEVNNATRPLRAAAAAAGDAERMSLWAGTGFAEARAEPAGEVVERLCPSPGRS